MPSQELLEDIFHLSLMMENVRFDHSFVVLRECHQGYIVVSLQFDTVLQFDAAGLLVFEYDFAKPRYLIVNFRVLREKLDPVLAIPD